MYNTFAKGWAKWASEVLPGEPVDVSRKEEGLIVPTGNQTLDGPDNIDIPTNVDGVPIFPDVDPDSIKADRLLRVFGEFFSKLWGEF